MNRLPSVSLCISTYNFPDALELCLMSILRQTQMPLEVIIGDDGSAAQTKELINSFRLKFSIPIKHVWHPDDGFKLAEIRNKSFAAAAGEYIIQIDGDIVLNRFFIEDHIRFAKPGTFVAGTRSMLTQTSTVKIFASKNIDTIDTLEIEKRYNTYRLLPVSYVMYNIQKGPSQAKFVLGANMAFWKESIIKVNGYDENYKGWGKEDHDLSIRLINAGYQLHFLKFAAVIYHLYHKQASNGNIDKNTPLIQRALREKTIFSKNGLDKYL